MSRFLLLGLLSFVSSVVLAEPVVFTDCSEFEHHISSCESSVKCVDSNFQPTAYSASYASKFSISQGLLKFECTRLTDCPQGTYLGMLAYEISCPSSSSYSTAAIDKFGELKENAAEQCGSIVGVDNQTVGESIPLVGTKFSFTHFSHMSGGRSIDYKLNVRITGSTATPGTDSYKLKIVKGNDVYLPETVLTNAANLSYLYLWNGKDLSGNVQIGPQKFTVITTQVFTDTSKPQIPIQQDVVIGTFNANALGFGGWMPSNYQFYSPANGILYSGNGKIRKVTAKSVTGQSGISYSVAEEDGSAVHFFDSVGRIRHTKLGLTGAAVFTFNYNSNGTLASIAEPFNLATNFIRDAQGDLFAIVAPRGSYTPAYCDAKCYQEQGQLVTRFSMNSERLIFGAWTLGMSKDFQMTYDSNGLLKTFKNRNGGITTFTYDGDGNLIKDEKNSGFFFDLVKSLVTPTSYRISSTTVGGLATTYDIVDLGSGTTSRTTTFPNGLVENYVFSKNSSEISFGGVSSQSTITDDPRIEGARFPSSESASYEGVNVNRTITKTFTPSSSGTPPWNIQSLVTKNKIGTSEATTTYNGAGVFLTTSPLGVVTETTIDSYERITSVKVGNLAPILYTYNGDRLASVSQNSKAVNFTYDGMGFLQNISENGNVVATYGYDWNGRVLSSVDASGFSVKYERNGEGDVTSVEIGPQEVVCGRRCNTVPSQRMHKFSFDLNDAISAYLTPLVNGTNLATTYQYNSDKQLTKITKPSGRYISSVYQPTTGVLTKFSTSEGDYDLTMNSTNGQVSSIKTPKNFTTSIGYAGTSVSGFTFKDGSNTEFGSYSIGIHPTLGLVASDKVKVNTVESQINYIYDADFNLKEAGDLVLTYDSNGQLASATIGSLVETYTRNTSGRLEDYFVKYNGQDVFYELVRYDSADRILRVSGKFPDLLIRQEIYTYYAGRLVGIDYYGGLTKDISYVDFTLSTPAVINNSRIRTTYNGETATYFYSKDDRLEKVVKNYQAGGSKTIYYAYRLDGEIESRTEYNTTSTPVLIGKTDYTYDIFGNLIKVVLPDTRVIEYEIDGMNRRVGKKINGVLQRRWIYKDDLRIVAELDGSGNLLKRFVYATKGNIPDYMVMNGDTYKIVSNHQGSLRTIVKVSDGSVVAIMDHDEFGKVLRDTNPGFVPFGYAGGLYDPDTALVRFGARDYDPEVGRWTSKDPILFDGGDANLYGYVENDPVNWIDSIGLAKSGQVKENDAFNGGGGGGPVAIKTEGTFYVAPNGQTVFAPKGSVVSSADGNGMIVKIPGSNHPNGNMIRFMQPDAKNPNGYIRLTDKLGRYLDVNGNIVNRNDPAGHICPMK